MRFTIDQEISEKIQEPCIGNVYNIRGGVGAKKGHMSVIISIRDEVCTTLSVNSEGEIVGCGNWGMGYFREKCPIAYCPNIEDLNFVIKRL